MTIALEHVHKRFGSFSALDGVDLEVHSGELLALLGPSGSGKTTLLRIIAGLEAPDLGMVRLFGEEATGLKVGDRRIGFVFQHYALFRHMTVFENVAFGLRARPRRLRPSRAAIAARVHELLRLVQLDSFADRYPSELSGGQRQRVALARTLAVEPKLLLLDEPFGSLDSRVRQQLRRWLKRIHRELGVTCVFVTHDCEEALELADRVVVMNAGRIEQVGTPEEVYHRPANAFVMGFLGNVNLFHARLENGRVYLGDTAFALEDPGHDAKGVSGKAALYLRPHLLAIQRTPDGNGAFAAQVQRVNPAGPQVRLELVTAWGDPVHVELSHERCRELDLAPGARVFLRPTATRVFMLDDDG